MRAHILNTASYALLFLVSYYACRCNTDQSRRSSSRSIVLVEGPNLQEINICLLPRISLTWAIVRRQVALLLQVSITSDMLSLLSYHSRQLCHFSQVERGNL